ncbi:MAG: hypothetical protein JWN70_3411 [Planctomycetaceae bacterium]|nr:hypothetical protein [Planctomycetaceae bacterium]
MSDAASKLSQKLIEGRRLIKDGKLTVLKGELLVAEARLAEWEIATGPRRAKRRNPPSNSEPV